MRRYRTEIVIAADRIVTLQLPGDLPAGRAILSIVAEGDPDADVSEFPGVSDDDFEWWDEFGAESEALEFRGLGSRLGALDP